MQSTTAMRLKCRCGKWFSQRSVHDDTCQACRPKAPVKARSTDAVFRRYVAGERERWTAYLLEMLGPFCGQPWFNDVANRLHGKPDAKPAKKKSAA